MVLKKPGLFVKKPSKCRVVWTIPVCSNFTNMWSKYLSNNVWRDLRLSMTALATVGGKSFNGYFTAKIAFPIGYFILPLLMSTLEVWSPTIHYLISIWTTCWWNLNKIVWSELCKSLTFWHKMVDHFWQSIDTILEDISVTLLLVWCKIINLKTIIFQCSKNYGSSTCVTRLRWHQTW